MVALAILAAACSSTSKNTATATSTSVAPVTSNEPVSMAVNFSPQSLDPASGARQLAASVAVTA